ncbi:MAG TPA: hypothetical protein VHW68_00700 [Actinomycetota bacterium]|jgi:hypothetical protein|nr:hypothetical protein [Actinomycetota bacterium]
MAEKKIQPKRPATEEPAAGSRKATKTSAHKALHKAVAHKALHKKVAKKY